MDKDTKDTKSDEALLKQAKHDFKLCVEAEAEYRKNAVEDLEFALLSKQWPEDVKRQREKEGRPCLTINRLPAFIKQVTNDARQNRPSINVHPSGDGSDKDVARIYRDLIRNIENVSKADIAYDTGLDFAAYSGIGYWVIRDQYTCEDSFDTDLVIERIANPLAVYGDYAAKGATSADWNLAFITDFYTESAYKKKWPGHDPSEFDAEGADDETSLWLQDKRYRVAEWWTREEVPATLLQFTDWSVMFEEEYLRPSEDDTPSLQEMMTAKGITIKGTRETKTYKVTQRIVSGFEILETNEWRGKYIPIVPCYGNEFNVNGKRHFQGLVRDAIDPARMFNYWRTASTELVALAPKAPWVGVVGQFATDPNWATANSATHQYLEADLVEGAPSLPQRQPFVGVPAGVLQEALSASDDLKNIMGLHDASLGAKSNETSGRAIMARQREGDVSTFNFADNRNRAIEHTGTILVDLIPKHYSTARIVRCVKEDGTTYSMPVNQPAAPAPQQGQQPTPNAMHEQYQPAQEEIPGLTKIFDLTVGKYDVTVTPGPSFTTRREEARESMMEFLRVLPQAGMVTGDLIAKAQDWPGAEEFAERLKAMLPPQAQGANPQAMQLQQQMQQMAGQAQQAVGELTQKVQQLEVQLKDKTVETQLKGAELQLKERELVMKEKESATKQLVEQTNAEAQRFQQVEMPAANHALNADAIMGAVQALQQVAASMQQKPTRKQAKAVKQPDGSYLMESLETPVEGPLQ